jgi:putative intracellular protease/amidase
LGLREYEQQDLKRGRGGNCRDVLDLHSQSSTSLQLSTWIEFRERREMKRALLIVPKENFSCTFYQRTRELLKQQGFRVQVASSVRKEIKHLTCTLTPNVTLHEVRGGDYDVIVFIAGRGNRNLLDDPEAHRVAREALAAGQVIGASGLAVGILANAGLLEGRQVTAPVTLIARLQAKGAKYTFSPVAVDDGIVTLRDAQAFPVFGQHLLEQVRRREETRKAA